jgi:hypothetical protein
MHEADQRGFPYATGYGPFGRNIPFLSGKSLESFEALWKIDPRPPGLVIEDIGSRWGDCIACGSGLPSIVISERTLNSIKHLKVNILTETEFPVGKIKSRKLRDLPPPRYFAVQWGGGIAVDWHATGVEHDGAGNPIIIPGKVLNFVAKLSTWTGDDVFSWTNWDGTHLIMLCTERVVELAAKEKWTNVRFDPVPTI